VTAQAHAHIRAASKTANSCCLACCCHLCTGFAANTKLSHAPTHCCRAPACHAWTADCGAAAAGPRQPPCAQYCAQGHQVSAPASWVLAAVSRAPSAKLGSQLELYCVRAPSAQQRRQHINQALTVPRVCNPAQLSHLHNVQPNCRPLGTASFAHECVPRAPGPPACYRPENIFFDKGGALVLGDFGLALSLSQDNAVSRVGTLEYMAPEVCQLLA
jgi:hypothetical protein